MPRLITPEIVVELIWCLGSVLMILAVGLLMARTAEAQSEAATNPDVRRAAREQTIFSRCLATAVALGLLWFLYLLIYYYIANPV